MYINLAKIVFMFNITIPTLLHWKSNTMLQHTVYNKNIYIKFSAHDTFLRLHLSGTLNIERSESQIV